MKVDTLLKSVLILLLVGLAVVMTSWVHSEVTLARADNGGGGSSSGEWMMVASTLRTGHGLLYMFNVKREVLLVYAYHRGRRSPDNRQFVADLQFLGGRHCKWDLLFSQFVPYPTERPKSNMHTPAQMKKFFERASE